MNDPVTRRALARTDDMTLELEERWFDALQISTRDVVLAIDTSAFIGTCGLHNIDVRHRSASLGIMIGDASARGRGYGTEAIELLLAHAMATLKLHRVELEVITTNTAAIRCYERVGFVTEGVRKDARFIDGAFVDLQMMRVLSAL